MNPTRGVLLIASNLPRTAADKIYEMWIIPKGAKPVPAGLFQSQDDGSAMHVRPGTVDLASTAAVAVTVENQAGADQPTTTPLIVARTPSALEYCTSRSCCSRVPVEKSQVLAAGLASSSASNRYCLI